MKSIELTQRLLCEVIKVATYISAETGDFIVNRQYCLMKKLLGNYINLYTSPCLAYNLGRELARLHIALLNVEQSISCVEKYYLTYWKSFVNINIVEKVENGLFNRIEKEIFEFQKKLPKQLIHNDLNIRNFLFDKENLSGWLDFDKHCRNIRVLDIAHLLQHIMNDLAFKNSKREKIKSNLSYVDFKEFFWGIYISLIEGYNQINSLSVQERDAIPILIIATELISLSLFVT